MANRINTADNRWLALPERMALRLAAYQRSRGMRTQTDAVKALVDLGLSRIQTQDKQKARSLPTEP